MAQSDRVLAGVAVACCELIRQRGQDRREDAEDVAQDVCVRALERVAPQAIQEPARYLARAARNELTDRRRRRRREQALFDPNSDGRICRDESQEPERIVSGQQALALVFAAIAALPPRCREAFELHRLEGINYVGIAHRMGISVSMVEKHVAEAMLRLVEALDGTDRVRVRARGGAI